MKNFQWAHKIFLTVYSFSLVVYLCFYSYWAIDPIHRLGDATFPWIAFSLPIIFILLLLWIHYKLFRKNAKSKFESIFVYFSLISDIIFLIGGAYMIVAKPQDFSGIFAIIGFVFATILLVAGAIAGFASVFDN